MINANQTKEPIKILGILKQSWLLYKENFSLFIGITILGYALGLLDALLTILSETIHTWVSFVIGPLGIFISIWASVALIIAVSNRNQGNRIVLKEAFIKTKGKYWRFIGISISYLLIAGTGLLLLLMPGIYWGTIYTLVMVVVVLEKRKDIGPFKISKELIRGSFWRVLLLGLIILVLLSPSYFIYFRLTKISQNIAMILGQIFFIFYMSFSTVVEVTLYHKLKEKKETEFPLEPEALVKRGKGWLGCLGAIGLVILIIVLSTFWISGLMKFFETERGSRVSEYIKEKISPQIIFPGDLTLQRPEGWLVMKTPGTKIRYDLMIFGNKKITKLVLWSIPIEDLNVSKTLLSLDSEAIGNEILEQTIKRSKMMEKVYQGYKPQPVKIIKLGNRSWGEYTLKETIKMEYAVRINISKSVYTIFDDYVLIANYGYRYKLEEEGIIKLEEDVLKEEKEIQNIISSIHFP